MEPADRIIKLRVGKERTILNVHESVLCKSSTWSKSTLEAQRAGRAKKKNTLAFPDEMVPVVKAYVNWLYTGAIKLELFDHWISEPEPEPALLLVVRWCGLLNAKRFGTKYLDADFLDAIPALMTEIEVELSKLGLWGPV